MKRELKVFLRDLEGAARIIGYIVVGFILYSLAASMWDYWGG